MNRRLLLFALLLLLAGAAVAQTPRDASRYERVLLPFHASVSNPSGVWSVQWWFRNEGGAAVDAFPLATQCGLPPPPRPDGPLVFVLRNPSLPSRTSISCPAGDALPSVLIPPIVPVVSAAPGAFLYIERAGAGDVIVNGTIRWFSHGLSGSAVELRGIRETSFLRGTRSVMPIPVVADRRYAIRIYALPESLASSPRATVRVYEMQPVTARPEEQLRATISVELQVPASRILPCELCDVPAAGYVPAVAQVFNLSIGSNEPRPSTLRIEIEPESPDLRWWAVVSATHNATNEMALYQPR